VTSRTRASLLELDRADFLEAIIGHPVARETADQTVQERLRGEQDMDAIEEA
jgi:hypothetical protein